jgi:hypothetical protein
MSATTFWPAVEVYRERRCNMHLCVEFECGRNYFVCKNEVGEQDT